MKRRDIHANRSYADEQGNIKKVYLVVTEDASDSDRIFYKVTCAMSPGLKIEATNSTTRKCFAQWAKFQR
jgi:hypothetical protein